MTKRATGKHGKRERTETETGTGTGPHHSLLTALTPTFQVVGLLVVDTRGKLLSARKFWGHTTFCTSHAHFCAKKGKRERKRKRVLSGFKTRMRMTLMSTGVGEIPIQLATTSTIVCLSHLMKAL